MKKKSFIALLACLLGIGSFTTSCEDMLTPDMDRYAEGFTGRDTVGFYLGILRDLQGVVEQNILLGDLRSDLASATDYCSDSISEIINFKPSEDGDNELLNRAAYYKVINQCNFYLAKVDTMVTIRNRPYMRKECAQVEVIRAWTYMQLVQNYGTVPFITVPVDRGNTGWETNPPEGWVNADNLLEKLGPSLQQAYAYEETYGSVNYGNFNTGALTVAHSKLVFPAKLVIADLYLLRGRSKSDYEKAASLYYDYLKELPASQRRSSGRASFMERTDGTTTTFLESLSAWAICLHPSSSQTITTVPSAANSFFGKVLTRIPQIYGFDPSSSNTTVGGTNDDGETTASTSGRISLTTNYKNRQVMPSEAYLALNKNQLYRSYEFSSLGTGADGRLEATDVTYGDVGDARLFSTAPYVSTDEGRLRFVQKFNASATTVNNNVVGFSFGYSFPVYRVNQVYLRYAEAINRAGFPRYAFTLLRDGVDASKMPTLQDAYVYDDDAKTVETVFALEEGSNIYKQLSADEVRRAADKEWLDWGSEDYWSYTDGMYMYGAHEIGCGSSYDVDSLYTYENVVLQRILDEEARSGVLSDAATARHRILADEGDDVEEGGEGDDEGDEEEPDRSDYTYLPVAEPAEATEAEINAVETLIADEMALETAYEGYRFYDLTRMARHKNNTVGYPSDYGTQWFAWLIARRGLTLAPYEDPAQKDGSLFSTLLNPANWYLRAPVQ